MGLRIAGLIALSSPFVGLCFVLTGHYTAGFIAAGVLLAVGFGYLILRA